MDNALIRKLGHFTRLSREDKALLTRVSGERVRHLAAREDIAVEGDKPDMMLLVLSGWAARYKFLADGRRQIMALFLPGDICDLNVFVLKQMDHMIGALTSVTLAEITREAYEELMQAGPRLTGALWWDSLVMAAIQREWTMNLGQRSAAERMAHLFCEVFTRLRSVGQTVGNGCELPLTQSDLGDATGLSTVHVNRTLKGLRGANLVEHRGKVLSIPDMVALQVAAHFNPAYLHLDHEGAQLDANE